MQKNHQGNSNVSHFLISSVLLFYYMHRLFDASDFIILVMLWCYTLLCLVIGYDDTASILCLQESQRQREMAEDRYTRYKEVVSNLQHQLDESKRKIQEYKVWHKLVERFKDLLLKNLLCNALQEPVLRYNNPHLCLFWSVIALLCSNTSGLDKDSLTLRAIYQSSTPTPVPMCAPHLICNLYE